MAYVNGTAGADLLFGAAAADLVYGGDGNDEIIAGAGDDELHGGEGDDVLNGQSGDDRLDGGAGNDRVNSTDQGDDWLLGGEGNDQLYVDRNHGGDALVLDGGAGNDRLAIDLAAAAAGIAAAGGEGDDAIEIFSLRSSLALSLGVGRDLVTMTAFRSSVQGGGRVVIADFEAGATGDRISFSSLTTFDFTGWNLNSNPFAAGYLKATQSGADVVISASFGGAAFVDAFVLSNVLLSSLTPENLGGWSWDGSAVASVVLTGADGAETLRGNGGSDELFGLGGDDILEGHAGSDILWGGDGNDILRGGQGSDQLHGGGGNDTMSSESSGDGLHGGDGDDRLTLSTAAAGASLYGSGGAGHDTISLSGSSETVTFSVDAGSGDDLVSIFSLGGSAAMTLGDGRDRLDLSDWSRPAASAATIVVGDFATGDGGDRLEWMNFLTRTLIGMDPALVFASGHVRLLQEGADTLLQIDRDGGGNQYSTLIRFLNTSAAAFTAYNLGGIAPDGSAPAGTALTGTADPDRLYGSDGGDSLDGLDGADILFGFGGDDEIRGGAGDDTIAGGGGDDAIDGGAGNDVITPGTGDDVADGGEGNDQFIDSSGTSYGDKAFAGGAGDDSIFSYRYDSADVLVAGGGEGNDYFSVTQGGYSSGGFFLDGGAGDDLFQISGYGELALGEGRDRVLIADMVLLPYPGRPFTILDLAVGDLGDRIDFWPLFNRFINFDRSANPFSTGHLRLVSAGSDTLILVDIYGAGASPPATLAILAGVSRYSLTAHNLGGYAPPFTLGTAAGETFQGDGGINEFVGGGGDDSFLIGYGGSDVAVGGTGNDSFYVAAGLPYPVPFVKITGGGGADVLQIQGKAAQTRLSLTGTGFSGSYETISATGIATIHFLSGFDSSRGWALGAPVRYIVDLGEKLAPAAAPLVIDTTGLAASESFSLDDGSFSNVNAAITLIGGSGADRVNAGSRQAHLDGGGGDDELHAGPGNDILVGGAGSDRLISTFGSVGGGVDLLDGGEGDDLITLAGGNYHVPAGSLTIAGGAGDDRLSLEVQGPAAPVAAVDLGIGADRLLITNAGGTYRVALGAGRDTIEYAAGLNDGFGVVGNVTITDFEVGPEGDVVSWTAALSRYLRNYEGQNPFGSGHARLLQDGADVLLQLSRFADGNFLTLLRFENRQVADFSDGIGGFLPAQPNGTPGDDVLVGTAGRDDFDGKGGNDILDGRGGADRMTGGTGDDIFYVDDPGDVVTESYDNGGTDEIRTTLASYSLGGVGYFEILRGLSDSGQSLGGDERANRLIGGAGDDVLNGQGGDDILDGGPGADRMEGGSGYDIFYVDHPGDVISETGGSSFDEVRTALAVYSLVGSPAEHLTADSDGPHEFRGNEGVNRLTGGGGNDVLLLHDGSEDRAVGLGGNDILYFGAAFSVSDVADGGDGRDALVLQGNVTLRLYDFNLIGIESISLQSGATTRYGDTANNFYDYNLTTDDANVAAGAQLIVNAQSLRAGEDFTFDGSAETDGKFLVYGGHGVDDLTGGDGVDAFFFEGSRWGANDKVNGGEGRDALVISGGSGLTHIAFAADALTSIESISLNNRFATDPTQKPSYELVLHNGNVVAGGTLIVNGSSIPGGQLVNIDGRGVHDGNLILFAGGGHDVLTAGDGADVLIGAGGADSLTGGAGADTFRYDAVSDSAGFADLIGDFQSGVDRIDLSRIDANANVAGDQAFSWIGSNAFSGSAGELRSYEADGYRWVAGDTDGNGAADIAIALQPGAPLVQGDFLL